MSCIDAKVNIRIIEGGTFDKEFLWESGDPAVAVDLTRYSAKFAIREKLADTTALVEGEEVSDPWETDGDTGI